MNIFHIAVLSGLGLMSLIQRSQGAAGPSPADLVKPLPGAPLSAEQVEERTRSLADADSVLEITRHTIYRDSAGRMRIESIPTRPHEVPAVSLIDPTSGSKVVLSEPDKIAYRAMGPKGSEDGFAYGFGGMGDGLPSANWITRTENLGQRAIDGNEFEGTRIIQTTSGETALTNKIESWYSSELKLTGLAVVSGPYGTHTARIQNLHREEPVPALFSIPADYRVVDVGPR
jgi:hypothetical protein